MAFFTPKLPSKNSLDIAKWVQYANPEKIKDLDAFLDKLPARAGMNGIIVACVIWAIAGAALLLSYTKSVNLRELRKELTQSEAILPTVPMINYTAVSETLVRPHVEKMKEVYKNLVIDVSAEGIKVTAASTRDFAAWRSAIGDLAYGGTGWRVQLKEMCAGRDCQGAPLQAILSVQQLDIKIPEAKAKG